MSRTVKTFSAIIKNIAKINHHLLVLSAFTMIFLLFLFKAAINSFNLETQGNTGAGGSMCASLTNPHTCHPLLQGHHNNSTYSCQDFNHFCAFRLFFRQSTTVILHFDPSVTTCSCDSSPFRRAKEMHKPDGHIALSSAPSSRDCEFRIFRLPSAPSR